jgi:septal ring factor EnvC (AmiA/AmiB activator)
MELVGAIVGTGVLSTGVTLWFGRRKADAEAEVTLSGGYGDFVAELRAERAEQRTELQAEREELKKERAEMRAELREAHKDNLELRQEIGSLRIELRAVKSDIVRMSAGLPPLTDWTQQT